MASETSETSETSEPLAVIVVVGSGGNIGSHLVPHLGRMPGIKHVILIDPDTYEAGNLLSQDIRSRDVGKKKVRVQARRLRALRADLQVTALDREVQAVPLGRLRGAMILTCLDSRASRRWVNQAVFRLGVPWIDAGVQADGLLARVTVYLPGASEACLECSWDASDYAQLEVEYPCGRTGTAPTRAPSGLGALAASLQALECQRRLSRTGVGDAPEAGREVLLDARYHKHYVTRLVRNPDCRFDHETWRVERLDRSPARVSLQDAFDLGGTGKGEFLEVEERSFATRLRCRACGRTRRTLMLLDALPASGRVCPGCEGEFMAPGFELLERLEARAIPAGQLRRSLHSLGFRPGDHVSLVSAGRRMHFELGGSPAGSRSKK